VDDLSFGGPAGVAQPERGAFASRAYPNPAHEAAIIEYTLPSVADLTLRVFDVMGREVALLHDGRLDAGRHSATFDGSALPNGIYIYEITAGSAAERGRIVLAH
jgi:glucuronoarabinoxylan endo-1,4-beta-xylanase